MGLFSWLSSKKQESTVDHASTLEDKVAMLSSTHVVGVAQHLTERQEVGRFGNMDTVRSFRLQVQYDDGQETTYSVEMRGRRFVGFVMEGDVVAIPNGKIRQGEVVELVEVRNLSGGDVRVRAT